MPQAVPLRFAQWRPPRARTRRPHLPDARGRRRPWWSPPRSPCSAWACTW